MGAGAQVPGKLFWNPRSSQPEGGSGKEVVFITLIPLVGTESCGHTQLQAGLGNVVLSSTQPDAQLKRGKGYGNKLKTLLYLCELTFPKLRRPSKPFSCHCPDQAPPAQGTRGYNVSVPGCEAGTVTVGCAPVAGQAAGGPPGRWQGGGGHIRAGVCIAFPTLHPTTHSSLLSMPGDALIWALGCVI